MLVRLALLSDAPDVVEMAAENAHATRPDVPFDHDKALGTFFQYLASGNPTIYVVEHDRQSIGFLMTRLMDYSFNYGQFLGQEVLYVRPGKRGTRAAAALMKHLILEAERLGASEIVGGNDNSFNSERTARFFEHFGFERVGFSLRRPT